MAWIYKILNKINGKTYVGCTINKPAYRWHCHKKTLRKNIHRNIRLQRAWNKYGEINFEFIVLEEVSSLDRTIICEKEHYFRTILNSEYNISPTDIPGTLTEEQKNKLSKSLKKRYKNGFSDEHRKNISISHKGILLGTHPSDEVKKKISENRKGKCMGESHPVYKGKYIFSHPIHGEEIIHQWGIIKKYGLPPGSISKICSGKRHSIYGWICKGKVS